MYFAPGYQPVGYFAIGYLPAAVSSTITASPVGIASGEAFGVSSIAYTTLTGLAPVGIASAEAFGISSIAYTSVFAPAGITSGELFGVNAIGLATTFAPAGIATGELFGTNAITFTGGAIIAMAYVTYDAVYTGDLTYIVGEIEAFKYTITRSDAAVVPIFSSARIDVFGTDDTTIIRSINLNPETLTPVSPMVAGCMVNWTAMGTYRVELSATFPDGSIEKDRVFIQVIS